jgi:hypothetical protein
MSDFQQLLGEQFLEMRWRCLSLAADMDRLQRSTGGAQAIHNDPEVIKLRVAMGIIMGFGPDANRAERLQMLFSDQSREISK